MFSASLLVTPVAFESASHINFEGEICFWIPFQRVYGWSGIRSPIRLFDTFRLIEFPVFRKTYSETKELKRFSPSFFLFTEWDVQQREWNWDRGRTLLWQTLHSQWTLLPQQCLRWRRWRYVPIKYYINDNQIYIDIGWQSSRLQQSIICIFVSHQHNAIQMNRLCASHHVAWHFISRTDFCVLLSIHFSICFVVIMSCIWKLGK